MPRTMLEKKKKNREKRPEEQEEEGETVLQAECKQTASGAKSAGALHEGGGHGR